MASRGNGMGVAAARMAYHRDGTGVMLLDQLRERHAGKESVDGRVQFFPEVVRHAALVLEAVLAPAALGGIERLLHGADDVRDGELRGLARQLVPAARTAHALHEGAPAQLPEELL